MYSKLSSQFKFLFGKTISVMNSDAYSFLFVYNEIGSACSRKLYTNYIRTTFSVSKVQ